MKNVPLSTAELRSQDLRFFKAFEILIAVVCLAIPLLLRLADTECKTFRGSISAYVEMKRSYLFGLLLCMAAMFFLFNGAVYFRNEEQGLMQNNREGKWYNMILGLSLLLVIIFPCTTQIKLHTIFAIIFFGGNAVVTALYTRHYKKTGWVLGVLTLAAFVFHFYGPLTLFWAEWISLVVIGIHFILQTLGIMRLAALSGNDKKTSS